MTICKTYKPHDPAPLSRADLANEAARRYASTQDPFFRAVAEALRDNRNQAEKAT